MIRQRGAVARFCFSMSLALLATLAGAGPVTAKSLRLASAFDPQSMDPHSLALLYQTRITSQIYESLVTRDRDFKTEPGLAVAWQAVDATTWRFKLRPNVKFHDGSPLTADDVVFSLERALAKTSQRSFQLRGVTGARKVDALTVDLLLAAPDAVLADKLWLVGIMSKAWCEKHGVTLPQDYNAKQETFAVRNANGTGPYVLVSREQDVKTVLRRNDAYWGKAEYPAAVSEIVYLTIKADATRVAALISGDVDFVHDVPVQDIDRLEKAGHFRVNFGPENRTIFLGMDVASPALATSNVKGKNPFADKRVRQAMNMTIDRGAIKRVVMRGQSVPAGIIAPPFVNGYTKELDQLPKVDLDKAKALLKDAGYAEGFQVTLHCPNDRYINDEGICQAVTGMLAKIGIKVNLVVQPKGPHFTLLQKTPPESDFYMLGWGVPTFDSHYVFAYLYHTRSGKDGGWNATRYSNPDLDKSIQGLTEEIDVVKRNAAIARLWSTLSDETVYIALHHQMVAHAMKSDLDIPVRPDNWVYMKMTAAK